MGSFSPPQLLDPWLLPENPTREDLQNAVQWIESNQIVADLVSNREDALRNLRHRLNAMDEQTSLRTATATTLSQYQSTSDSLENSTLGRSSPNSYNVSSHRSLAPPASYHRKREQEHLDPSPTPKRPTLSHLSTVPHGRPLSSPVQPMAPNAQTPQTHFLAQCQVPSPSVHGQEGYMMSPLTPPAQARQQPQNMGSMGYGYDPGFTVSDAAAGRFGYSNAHSAPVVNGSQHGTQNLAYGHKFDDPNSEAHISAQDSLRCTAYPTDLSIYQPRRSMQEMGQMQRPFPDQEPIDLTGDDDNIILSPLQQYMLNCDDFEVGDDPFSDLRYAYQNVEAQLGTLPQSNPYSMDMSFNAPPTMIGQPHQNPSMGAQPATLGTFVFPPGQSPQPSFAQQNFVPQNFVQQNLVQQTYVQRNSVPQWSAQQEAADKQKAAEIAALLDRIQSEDVLTEGGEPTPAAMQSKLMAHQQIALAWFKKQESNASFKGGILADGMGLGKTVEAISLIIARPSDDQTCKTTLLVAPLNVIRQWERELVRHVKPEHQLKVFVYHDKGRKRDWDHLRTYDVVITTYGLIGSEYKKIRIREEAERFQTGREDSHHRQQSSLKLNILGPQCRWYRVILDEAQHIKGESTEASRGLARIHAEYRLVMTGTPMQNSVDELYPLIRFLKIPPYNNLARFNQDVSLRMRNRQPKGGVDDSGTAGSREEKGMQIVQGLLKSLMLRRKKDTLINGKPIVNLPPKHEHLHDIILSSEERQIYDNANRKIMGSVTSGLKQTYMELLVKLLRLRQICCHPNLIAHLMEQEVTGEIDGQELCRRASRLSRDVVYRLKEMTDVGECSICLDNWPNPVIFIPCGHTCCGDDFNKLLESNPKCPSCRELLDKNRITDYKHFCQVHCREKLAELRLSDSEDDSDSDSELDSDEGDDINDDGNLRSFVVSDDADDDFEPSSGQDRATSSKSTPEQRQKRRAKRKQKLAVLKKASLKSKSAKKRYLNIVAKTYKSSSKIDKVLELIDGIMANDPTEKILIFSQFTSFLDLVEVPLHTRGLKYQRIDGTMKADARDDAVCAFTDDPNQRIMLLSTKAGNAGLNLAVASQVILLDPFWNPFVEDQAVDRAHRMPQQREVHVHRLLCPDTVEYRILEIQEKKKAQINAALDENAAKNLTRLSRNDLMHIFGLRGRVSF